MTKVIVEIELSPGITEEDIRSGWRPTIDDSGPKEGWISVDNAYLKADWDDDSFYAFKLIEVIEDG